MIESHPGIDYNQVDYGSMVGGPVSGQSPEQWYQTMYGRPYSGQNIEADLPSLISGLQTQVSQDAAASSGGLEDMLVMLAAGGAMGGMAAGAAGAGGLGAETALGGSIPELGMVANQATANTALAGGISPSMLSGGTGALTLEGLGAGGAMDMYGSLGTPAASGVGGAGYVPVDTAAYMNATGSSLGSALTGTPSGGLPNIPTSAVQQLIKALTGGSGTGTGGGSLFGQSGTPGGSSYMRKARPPMTQPAFLGEQGQQPLGSVEDEAFNEMVAGRSEDTSNRARQMAAQLRGRPSILGFRS